MTDPMELMRAKGYAHDAHELFPNSIIYLFGSQAKGTATEESDVDIAILIDRYRDAGPRKMREARAQLSELCRKWYDRNGPWIEPHIVTRAGDMSFFIREIEETGIVLESPEPDKENRW